MNRGITSLAAVATAGLTVATLPVPAEAAPSEQAAGSAFVSHTCRFRVAGETLRIALGLHRVGDDVENVAIRATDNNESGRYDNNRVRLKRIRLTVWDEDGIRQVDSTVAPSSPGSFDLGSAGDDAGKVRVRVRWRTHGATVNAVCGKILG